jgi:hypothetical protein
MTITEPDINNEIEPDDDTITAKRVEMLTFAVKNLGYNEFESMVRSMPRERKDETLIWLLTERDQ